MAQLTIDSASALNEIYNHELFSKFVHDTTENLPTYDTLVQQSFEIALKILSERR